MKVRASGPAPARPSSTHLHVRCSFVPLPYAVTAKASPEEGLRALRDNPEGIDLVLTVAHTRGTGIDGFELLKHAGKRYPVIRKSLQ